MNSVIIQMQKKSGIYYSFNARDEKGNTVDVDASDAGSPHFGTRPMQMVLMALGSCSGIDIISMLNKQKQTISNFRIAVTGVRRSEIPSLWQDIHMDFDLGGELDYPKVWRACHLSIEKYCSVAETLRRAGATIKWNLMVNGSGKLQLPEIRLPEEGSFTENMQHQR